MTLPTRSISSYTLPLLNTGSLLQENGSLLTQEDGFELLLENPTQNPSLTTRNVSAYSLPSRN